MTASVLGFLWTALAVTAGFALGWRARGKAE